MILKQKCIFYINFKTSVCDIKKNDYAVQCHTCFVTMMFLLLNLSVVIILVNLNHDFVIKTAHFKALKNISV